MRKLILLFALTLSIGLAQAQETPEPNTLPTPESNQIIYRSSDHQKITPNNPNAFGATILSNTYDADADYGIITFDGNITAIGDWAFTNCTTLTAVVWPSMVTNIGYSAFQGCTNLNSINIQEGVRNIENDAFSGCTNVTSVTFAGYVALNARSFTSIGTIESPVNLKIPSAWMVSDKPVDSATPWHGGYFNCEYTDPIKEFLGEMGEPCEDCPSIEVTKGDKTLKLVNPEKVEFGKQER